MTEADDTGTASATLTVFTDPFCTWSWGSEPILRRIQETYPSQVDVEFVMGGLVEDFDTFHDGANGISKPADVAPHWRKAATRHGMPVDAGIWLEDPPTSSHPPSVAYEAARLVDAELADAYLRRLREAFAAERRRIDDAQVLLELASEVGLDVAAFQHELDGERARRMFREDLERTRRRKAGVFPSYRIHAGGDAALLRGFQRFEAIARRLEELAPALERREPRPLDAFVEEHGRVATREVEEVYGLDHREALDRIEALQARGELSSQKRGSGRFWVTG